MRRLRLLSFFGLLASTFILSIKFLQPIAIQLVVEGTDIEMTQLPAFYALSDVVTVAISSIVFGSCLVYLVLSNEEPSSSISESRKENWTDTLDKLVDNDERTIYTLLMEGGGLAFQSDLVNRSGFTKGKVSLILDRLEAGGAVERKRSGMTNIVLLKGALGRN